MSVDQVLDPAGTRQLVEAGRAARRLLRTTSFLAGDRFELYNAGIMGGKVRFGVFPRDLFITGLILQDQDLLRETIRFSVLTMGTKCDPKTGEEPGRVLHEYPDVRRNGLSSRYSATETSQLLILGAAAYLKLSGDRSLISRFRDGLRAAGEYVLRHIRDNLFWEDPAFCGGRSYFARATYWKDSHLPGRDEPCYPVAYTLVQAQTAAALRALIGLNRVGDLGFAERALARRAAGLIQSIQNELWDSELDFSAIALDGGGLVSGVSSDGLHLLAYLHPGDISPEKLCAIEQRAEELATPYGVRTYAPGQRDYSPYAYHLGAIWPYEQYFIARGALMHGISYVAKTALRTVEALGAFGFVELFYWEEGVGLRGPGLIPGEGCELQLWSTAVPEGFARLVGGSAPKKPEGHDPRMRENRDSHRLAYP